MQEVVFTFKKKRDKKKKKREKKRKKKQHLKQLLKDQDENPALISRYKAKPWSTYLTYPGQMHFFPFF